MKIYERSLIEGLSFALDVAEKNYFSHSKHVAYTSFLLAKELDLPEEQQKNIYYGALLHDIGVGNSYTMEEHCMVGHGIILGLPMEQSIAEAVLYHHEYQDGTGPFHLTAGKIPLAAQIICLANFFDISFIQRIKVTYDLTQEIDQWIHKNEALFYTSLVNAFETLIKKEYFLLDYYNNEFNGILSKRIIIEENILDFDKVKLYAEAFSKIIDNRSKFTYHHSLGIAEIVNKVTKTLGYSNEIQNKMHIAALLHDIGKLAVSKEIIEKDGPLTEQERFEINKHTYYTRWILEQITGFEDITDYAANHHEKLNGKGYPLHLKGAELGTLERIMAICDIYQALTEERPYRENLSSEKIWNIFNDMVNRKELEGILVNKIKAVLP